MPSTIQFSSTTVNKTAGQSIYTRSAKKQKMSITQTYFLAHSARGKLSREAGRADHDLRLLVGHANMLDSLMLDLANAEQEQEQWFNKSLSGAREEEEEPEHIETIEEEDESEDETQVSSEEVDSDMEEDDETDSDLVLTRTPSRHSPPALSADYDSESDDESMPPSPPSVVIDTLSEKQRQAIATTSFYDSQDNSLSPVESETFEQEGFFLPTRQQPTIIAAY